MYIGDKKIEDWGIVTEFTIGEPAVREKKYQVPGRSGKRDASEALTGYPIYDERPLSLTVYVKKKTPKEYKKIYDEIHRCCHGKVQRVSFPFDNEYYYEGRLKVSVNQKDNSHGKVTISGDVYPFALKKDITRIDISSDSADEREIILPTAGMPTEIKIETDADITITRNGSDKSYSAGAWIINAPLLVDEEIIIVKGAAAATVSYQEGKL